MRLREGLLRLTVVSLIVLMSLSAAAGNITFKFPKGPRKLTFHFEENQEDEVVFSDDGQLKHIIFQGTIAAVTESSNKDSVRDTTRVMGNRKILVKNLGQQNSMAIAILNNRIVAIDQTGLLYPLPNEKDLTNWDDDWKIRDVFISDPGPFAGDSFKIIARTKIGNSTKTKTVLTIIHTQSGRYETRTIDTDLHTGFDLQTMKFHIAVNKKEKPWAGLYASNHQLLTDANGADVEPFFIDDMKAIPDFSYTPAAADPRLALMRNDANLPPTKLTPEELELQKKEQAAAKEKAALDNLKKEKDFMATRIKGQPEVIERLYNLEVKKYFYGNVRENPEVIYFMGLPATGKDTSADAYVDAMFGQTIGASDKHLYRMPVVKSKAELWSLEGSSTGYVGSQEITPWIRWLVQHSGGKYKLIEERGSEPHVEDNPAWKPGMVLEGYFAPEKSVVFVNEVHNWPKKLKDYFLKQGIETGRFRINNPGSGLSELRVPVTFILASNEGINLMAPRKANGERVTGMLSYKQLLENWTNAYARPDLLRGELVRTNGLASSGSYGDESPGSSEEFLSRIPPSNLILFRPLSPENLQDIVTQKLADFQRRSATSFKVDWTPNLVQKVQQFDFDAELNARPIADNVRSMVEEPIIKAVAEGRIKRTSDQQVMHLDIKENADKTLSLIVGGGAGDHNLSITVSEKNRPVPLKTDEELDQIATLGDRLKKHVFGADHAAHEIAKDILVSDEGRGAQRDIEKSTEPARTYLFLGPSSTGKTELAKSIAREYLGSESAMKTFDFSQVRTIDDLKVRILGSRDSLGNAVPSDFMYEYDAHQGRIVVVLDELANAPKETLQALYDVLREPVVRTFSDGKARSMSNVILIGTGNASQEWYVNIPRHLPIIQQQAAMARIHAKAMANPEFRRQTLEKYFSEATVNRIGESNIYFFSHLDFKAIRELTQLKMLQAIKRMETAENRRAWQIRFASKEDYVSTLEAVENEGFILREQGASLDRFVKQDFESNLKALLLTKHVPNQAQVILARLPDTKNAGAGEVNYKVVVNGKDSGFNFELGKRVQPTHTTMNKTGQTFVAYHEANHSLNRHVLFPGKSKETEISIRPGVTQIGDQMVAYEGIASWEELEKVAYSYEVVIRHMAVFAAGYVGQGMAENADVHDAGKSNDMERSTQLAQLAILKWGLSPKFGKVSVPQGMTMQEFIQSFDDARRKDYNSELDRMLTEAENMAKAVTLTNMTSALIPLGTKLAEDGVMDGKALETFYKAHDSEIDMTSYIEVMKDPKKMQALEAQWLDRSGNAHAIDAGLSKNIPAPSKVADIDQLVATEKALAIAQVAMPEKLPVAEWSGSPTPIAPTKESFASVEAVADNTAAHGTLFFKTSCTNVLNFGFPAK